MNLGRLINTQVQTPSAEPALNASVDRSRDAAVEGSGEKAGETRRGSETEPRTGNELDHVKFVPWENPETLSPGDRSLRGAGATREERGRSSVPENK